MDTVTHILSAACAATLAQFWHALANASIHTQTLSASCPFEPLPLLRCLLSAHTPSATLLVLPDFLALRCTTGSDSPVCNNGNLHGSVRVH